MPPPIVRSPRPVTLVGGGPACPDRLLLALNRAPLLVAADGGADRAKAHGKLPDAIIGDLDSLSNGEWWRKSGIAVHHIPEQSSTDFEKCVSRIAAPLILAVGFTGGRFDHALAVMSALVAFRHQPVLVLAEADVIFYCPPELKLTLPVGSRISFFPMLPVRGLESEGLRWSVAGLQMAPGGMIGTSNETIQPDIYASFEGHGLLAILPLAHLDDVIASVWPRA